MTKDNITRILNELKSLISHDTYALTENNINELSWKIDKLKEEILETYKNKSID